MKILMKRSAGLAAALAAATVLLAGAPAAWACGVCGCSISTDWASLGYAFRPGFRMDLRFEYFVQDQLRSGTHRVDRASFAFPSEQEVQIDTFNRNLTLDVGDSPGGAEKEAA